MEKALRENRSVVFCERPPFPHNMLVELTNVCNHHCVFCGYRNMTRARRQCDRELTFDIMRQAYENGTREIGFYMIGEPFAKPDLEDYVAHARDLGFEYIYLTTNGALATPERTKKLIGAGLNSIKFSVNAATPEHYRLIHGSDDYQTVKANVSALRRYVTENHIELSMFLSFVKTEPTKGDIEQLHADFDGLVDKIYVFDCANQGGTMPNLIDSGLVRAENIRPGSHFPCDMVFNRLHITCEGYLDACCVDVDGLLAAVDLRKTSLPDAWYSDVMIDLRRRFLQNRLDGTLCYNCINNASAPVEPLNKALCQDKT